MSIAAMTPVELGRALMRGDRDSFKLGYSAENAALAVIERHPLDTAGWLHLRADLLGFAHGLLHLPSRAAEEHLTARMPEALRDPTAAADYRAGQRAGLAEDVGLINPADLDR
jgi:hypothetical protein